MICSDDKDDSEAEGKIGRDAAQGRQVARFPEPEAAGGAKKSLSGQEPDGYGRRQPRGTRRLRAPGSADNRSDEGSEHHAVVREMPALRRCKQPSDGATAETDRENHHRRGSTRGRLLRRQQVIHESG